MFSVRRSNDVVRRAAWCGGAFFCAEKWCALPAPLATRGGRRCEIDALNGRCVRLGCLRIFLGPIDVGCQSTLASSVGASPQWQDVGAGVTLTRVTECSTSVRVSVSTRPVPEAESHHGLTCAPLAVLPPWACRKRRECSCRRRWELGKLVRDVGLVRIIDRSRRPGGIDSGWNIV